MHALMIVFGDEPERRAAGTTTPSGRPDWTGIGGRFTGYLVPRPDAGTARTYGDTLLGAEALIGAMLPKGVDMQRPRSVMNGVDQLRRHDLDVVATIKQHKHPPYILDEKDDLYHAGLTLDEDAVFTAHQVAASLPDDFKAADDDSLPETIKVKLTVWKDRAISLLEEAPGGTLFTAVDLHL